MLFKKCETDIIQDINNNRIRYFKVSYECKWDGEKMFLGEIILQSTLLHKLKYPCLPSLLSHSSFSKWFLNQGFLSLSCFWCTEVAFNSSATILHSSLETAACVLFSCERGPDTVSSETAYTCGILDRPHSQNTLIDSHTNMPVHCIYCLRTWSGPTGPLKQFDWDEEYGIFFGYSIHTVELLPPQKLVISFYYVFKW